MKKFVLLSIISFGTFFNTAALALPDISITSTVTTSQFPAFDQDLSITGSGRLDVNTTVTENPAIFSSASMASITVNPTSSSDGIFASGDHGAIQISGSLTTLDLLKGKISGDSTVHPTVGIFTEILGFVGTPVINLSTGTEITNSSTAGVAILLGGSHDTALTIDNAGTISTHNDTSAIAISLYDADGGSSITLDNSGTVNAGSSGYAAYVWQAGNSITINNSGSGTITGAINSQSSNATIYNLTSSAINGNISATSGDLDINNSLGIINGNITLGTNASSSLAIDGGTINGNILMNNATQTVTFGGGALNGTIDGAGKVLINENLTTGLNPIGYYTPVSEIVVADGKTFRTDFSGNIVKADKITLGEGSTFYHSVGALQGTIDGAAANSGTIYFNLGDTGDRTISATLGSTNGLAAATFNVTLGTLNITNNVKAQNVNILGAASTLNLAASKSITGNVIISSGNSLILNDGSSVSGDIKGASNGIGTTTIADNASVSGGGNFGISSFKLAELDIGTGANLTIASGKAINASTTNLRGELDFNSASTTTGNIVMIGSSAKFNTGGFSHSISGNFTTSSGSTITTTVHESSADQILVSGLASLNANTKINITISSGAVANYTIIAGGDGSTISTVSDANILINGTSTNLYGDFILHTEVSGNNLLLNILSNRLDNPNNQAAFAAINGATSATGSLAVLKTYLSGSDSLAQKSEAAKSANAQVDNSTNRLTFNNIDTIGNLISSRIESVRSGVASGDAVKNKAMWMQAMGASMKQGNTSAGDGYNAKTSGFAFGFDSEVKDDLVLGISGAYSHSNINGRNSSKDTFIDSYQLSVYSGYDAKDFFVNTVLGLGFNEYKSSRYIATAANEARANYSGQSYSARAEIGKNFTTKNDIIFTPTITLTAAKNSVDSYDESGAGTLNLHVRNDSANFFEGRAGAQIKKFYKTASGAKFAPQFSVSYGYDFAGNKQKATANFIGQNANFATSGSRIAQGSLKIGAGVDFFALNDVTLSANYIFENRNQYTAHSGWLKARYPF